MWKNLTIVYIVLHFDYTRRNDNQLPVSCIMNLIVSYESNKSNQKLVKLRSVAVKLCDHGLRTPREFFFQKSQTFPLGQTHWAKIFKGIWGIFSRTLSTQFGVHFFYRSTIIFIKKQAFISKSQLSIWDWDLNFGHKELGI